MAQTLHCDILATADRFFPAGPTSLRASDKTYSLIPVGHLTFDSTTRITLSQHQEADIEGSTKWLRHVRPSGPVPPRPMADKRLAWTPKAWAELSHWQDIPISLRAEMVLWRIVNLHRMPPIQVEISLTSMPLSNCSLGSFAPHCFAASSCNVSTLAQKQAFSSTRPY